MQCICKWTSQCSKKCTRLLCIQHHYWFGWQSPVESSLQSVIAKLPSPMLVGMAEMNTVHNYSLLHTPIHNIITACSILQFINYSLFRTPIYMTGYQTHGKALMGSQ